MDIEIGRAKRGRRAYSFDDVAIVPSRRTRDPEEVSVAWQIDAYRFELPILAAPMDSVMSPETAIALGRYGGLGVLNLEGLWTRYDDPSDLLAEAASMPGPDAVACGPSWTSVQCTNWLVPSCCRRLPAVVLGERRYAVEPHARKSKNTAFSMQGST